MNIRVVLNGKKAALEPVRAAIYSARESSRVDVRVTWEAGDVRRLVLEACAEGCRRLVAGGGDGTVNEVVDAMLQLPADERLRRASVVVAEIPRRPQLGGGGVGRRHERRGG